MNKGFLLTTAMTISMLHASEELHSLKNTSTSAQGRSVVIDLGGNDKAFPRLNLGGAYDRLGLNHQREAMKIIYRAPKTLYDFDHRAKVIGIYESIGSDPNATIDQKSHAVGELRERGVIQY